MFTLGSDAFKNYVQESSPIWTVYLTLERLKVNGRLCSIAYAGRPCFYLGENVVMSLLVDIIVELVEVVPVVAIELVVVDVILVEAGSSSTILSSWQGFFIWNMMIHVTWAMWANRNLCTPFKHDIRCASLCGVEFVVTKERREKRAQRE